MVDERMYFVGSGSAAAAELAGITSETTEPMLFYGPGSLDPEFLWAATATLRRPWAVRFPSLGPEPERQRGARRSLIDMFADPRQAERQAAEVLTQPHDLMTLVAHGGGGHMTLGSIQICATADVYPGITACRRGSDGEIICRRPRADVRVTLSPCELNVRRLILVGCSLAVASEYPVIGDLSLAIAAGRSGTEELLISQALIPMPSEVAEEAHRFAEAGHPLMAIAAKLNEVYWARFHVRPFLAFAREVKLGEVPIRIHASANYGDAASVQVNLEETQAATASAEWFGAIADQAIDPSDRLHQLVKEHRNLSLEAARLEAYRARGGLISPVSAQALGFLPTLERAWGEAALAVLTNAKIGHTLLEGFFASVEWRYRWGGAACPSCGRPTELSSGRVFVFEQAGAVNGVRCWVCGVLELSFAAGPRVEIEVEAEPGGAQLRVVGEKTNGLVFCVRDKTNEMDVLSQRTNKTDYSTGVSLPVDIHECFAFGVTGMRFAFAFRHVVSLPGSRP